MSFNIDYDIQPKDFLRKCEKEIARRIFTKIEETLTNNPVPHDAKAIVGAHGTFRIRIGDYRALYRIDYENKNIIIFKIDKRSKIY